MNLDEYRQKRSFNNTPEPPPGHRQPPGARFFIQRHQARRLHYDLRLEAGGVLKSWAVPKGPTLDPQQKRLAVLVEDHPLDYGVFEGTIPSGNYGAGSVIVWDRGTYELIGQETFEKQFARGDIKFQLRGQKLMGNFALARMKNRGKGNEWLLIKKKDFAAFPGWDAEVDTRSVLASPSNPANLAGAVASEPPANISPMLALASSSLPEGPEWLFELKWDGVRALCFLEKGKVKLVSRTGNAMEKQYPELSGLTEFVSAESAVLDGEIVALDEQGRPNFGLLQSRIGSSGAASKRTQPIQFVVFDLLYLNGYDLRRVPIAERKGILQSVVQNNRIVRYSEHFPGNGRQLLQFARDNGLEGIVAKRANSRYESKRTGDWLKIKVVAQQDFVICGFTKGERKHFGSLVLGVSEDQKLVYVGNVGAGFDEKLLRKIYELMQSLKSPVCPFDTAPDILRETTWIKPQLVCAVRFSSWTKENRLRAPVFQGLRNDVTPSDCVREAASDSAASTNVTASSEIQSDTEASKVRPHLLPIKQAEALLIVDGTRLKFTNLNKVFFPQENYTKRDVINYYDAVAELILPHLQDRPLSLKRYPNGIHADCFFQKDSAASFPSWLRTEPIFSEHNQAPINFVVADTRASLLYLANLGCIDQNPWMSRVASLENPDFVLIDLDPSNCGYDRIVEAAQLVRRKLELIGLEGYPKTTGGDGMHIYIPIEPRYTYSQARSFAEILARLLAHERPDLFTTPRTVSSREKGKVYFDYLQISSGKTISAPYVLRAYSGAPVSTPLAWQEVTKGLSPFHFHIGNVLDRFARMGDIFQPVLTRKLCLEDSLGKLESLLTPS